jgi:hypothetical protein
MNAQDLRLLLPQNAYTYEFPAGHQLLPLVPRQTRPCKLQQRLQLPTSAPQNGHSTLQDYRAPTLPTVMVNAWTLCQNALNEGLAVLTPMDLDNEHPGSYRGRITAKPTSIHTCFLLRH